MCVSGDEASPARGRVRPRPPLHLLSESGPIPHPFGRDRDGWRVPTPPEDGDFPWEGSSLDDEWEKVGEGGL